MRQATSPPVWAGPFRSLRHPNYRLYFFGQMVSVTGFWMQMTALRWLAYDLTEATRWVAAIGAAQNLPTVFLAGFGGALADRYRRWSLIFVTQTAFMTLTLVLSGLVAAGLATPALLLAFATASGIIHALDVPARLAFVKDMVGRDDLLNAVALNSLQFNVARIVGPWVGGLLLVSVGPWPCFLANALSYAAVLAALWHMEVPAAPEAGAAGPPMGAALSGIGYVLRQPTLAVLVLLAAAVSFFGWPFLELLPALARNYLGVQELGYSRLLTSTGVGALTAALAVATFGSERHRKPALALGVAAVAGGLVGLSLSRTLWLGALGCGLIGFGLILFLTTAQSAVQLSVSDEQRGRVMGIWAMVWGGTPPLANLILGPAADAWGEPAVLLTQGLGLIGVSLALVVLGRLWR